MSDPIQKQDITGLILAGGRATRMGQIDKGLQPLNGTAMAAQVLQRLSGQTGAVIINANRNLDTYRSFGCPVYPDLLEGYAGPLAGLQAGLAHCSTPYLVSVPCDSPFLAHDLVEKLAAAMTGTDIELAVAATIETENGQSRVQTHPVFALAKSSLLAQLDEFLSRGGRKVDAWFATLKTAQVVFDDNAAFRNINTLQELNEH